MTKEQQLEIGRAIAEAEGGTTGRIAVRVINVPSVDAFERAKAEFHRVGLHKHAEKNAALILVAPAARTFAIIGDSALHERVGDAFWNDVVKESRPFFARGETQAGILYAIARLGEVLHANFATPS